MILFLKQSLKKKSSINYNQNEEITDIPEGIVIIATGPLTSESLSQKFKNLMVLKAFIFTMEAPIIDKSTIDMDKVYLKSRYNKGKRLT